MTKIEKNSGITTAILLTQFGENLGDANSPMPLALMPLLDKPMLLRVMEQLARLHIKQVQVVLGDSPQAIKNALGNGERWGCQIEYHYSHPRESLHQLFRRLHVNSSTMYLLVNAQQLPTHAALASCPNINATARGCAPCWKQYRELRWSGWAWLSGAWLLELHHSATIQALAYQIRRSTSIIKYSVEKPLSVGTAADFHTSTLQLLENASEPLHIGRGCKIHPRARIIEPVFIGAHVQIGAGASIGPNAIICAGSSIDSNANIEAAIVLPETYVGQNTELNNVVVHGQQLINIALNTRIDIFDSQLLADLHSSNNHAPHHGKWLAVVLRALLAPFHSIYVNAEIAPTHQTLIHFRDTFYPGLTEIILGHLRLIGPSPRNRRSIAALPEYWQQLYVDAHRGLLSEAVLQTTTEPEILFACDAIAAGKQDQLGWGLKLLTKYLALFLLESRRYLSQRASKASSSGLSCFHEPAMRESSGDHHAT